MIDVNDSRQTFYESWIRETPDATPPRSDYSIINSELEDFVSRNGEQEVSQDIYYSESKKRMFVYSKQNKSDGPEIILSLEINPENLSVTNTSSKSDRKNTPPYPSDLYIAALKLAKGKSLVFRSDKEVSGTFTNPKDNKKYKGAVEIWKRLVKDYPNHQVSVYDTTNKSKVGQTLVPINSEDELLKYFGKPDKIGDDTYSKWRFVLSENEKHFYESVYELFSIRRIRELTESARDYDYE